MFEHLNTPNGLNVSLFEKLIPETRVGIIGILNKMCERFPSIIEKLSDNRPKIYRLKLQTETLADREMNEKLIRLNQLEEFAALFHIRADTPESLKPVLDDKPEEMVRKLLRSYEWSRSVLDQLNTYVISNRNPLVIFIHAYIRTEPAKVIQLLCQLAHNDSYWGTSEKGN